MAVMERTYITVRRENLEKLRELTKRSPAIAKRLGIPAGTFYSCFSGPRSVGTLAHDREWESFAAMMEGYELMGEDAENQAIMEDLLPILEDQQKELLFKIDSE